MKVFKIKLPKTYPFTFYHNGDDTELICISDRYRPAPPNCNSVFTYNNDKNGTWISLNRKDFITKLVFPTWYVNSKYDMIKCAEISARYCVENSLMRQTDNLFTIYKEHENNIEMGTAWISCWVNEKFRDHKLEKYVVKCKNMEAFK